MKRILLKLHEYLLCKYNIFFNFIKEITEKYKFFNYIFSIDTIHPDNKILIIWNALIAIVLIIRIIFIPMEIVFDEIS